MTASLSPPTAQILHRFSVSNPIHIAETGIANIWQVTQRSGQLAGLKLYKSSDMGNEAPGFTFLQSKHGRGAVQVLDLDHNAALMEWLPGGSLGALSRAGQDQVATAELVQVALKLHQTPTAGNAAYPALDGWFSALMALSCGAHCPAQTKEDIHFCQSLVPQLLRTQQDVQPLHGDLHHDNILHGKRGYCAIDAKGVCGERTFELANAFRNPAGAETLVRDPQRIARLATEWSCAFEVDRARLLDWATVKSALSIAWRTDGVLHEDAELDLLTTLRHAPRR
ncbi:MAG: phosphotransferase [Thalassovita sp.]